MNTDYPIIAHQNLLDSFAYTVTVGADETFAPITNVANGDKLRPALPVTDASGGLSITFDFTNATAAEVFILGADRHDAAGYKTTGGTFALDYWNGTAFVSLISATSLTAKDTSTIYKLSTHTLGLNGAVFQYRLAYAGLTASATTVIPELFLGTALEMPPVDYGFDDYPEVFRGAKFNSTLGRIYKTLNYRRLEMSPSWSVVERTQDVDILALREETLELLKSFWFAWQPDTSPNECYLFINDADKIAYPMKSPVHRTFKLKLIEVI